MAFLNTVVARAAASIWGLKLGNATMDAVLTQMGAGSAADIARVVNEAHNRSFGHLSNEAIASAFVANFGMTGSVATAATADVISQLSTTTSTTRGAKLLDIATSLAGLTSDPTYGSFANAFNAKVAYAVAWSSTEGTGDLPLMDGASGSTFILGTGRNSIVGTSGDDVISAYIFDNSNTLQSGDFVDGAGGVDTLFADMGSSQGFAVTPVTVNVERLVIRGQSRSTDSGDNNIQNEGRVLIDAERLTGENRLESNNSRADVLIEDERIAASQITKDITIAWVQSDPGNVDFGVYFDQPSLRASTTSSATLTLEIIDQKAAAEGAAPLRDSPFDGFRMSVNGVDVQFTSTAFQNAQTYAELLSAIQAQLALDPRTNGIVTAALGSPFTILSATGVQVTGTQVVLSATNATLGTGAWIALGGVPPNSDTYTNMFSGLASADDLVTSTIILDDVGRGSTSGDLVVGGLSVGETSTSRGVDRFEITVERTSRVQNIESTNNWLKEVTFRNGTTAGDVIVNGSQNSVGDGTQNLLPGISSVAGGNSQTGTANSANGAQGFADSYNNHDAYGFNDVRMVDASAMTGRVTFDAHVSNRTFSKYITTVDTDVNPATDNTSVISKTTQRADFSYSGGSNNDTMVIDVDGDVATQSQNSILSGREDFSFRVNGNNGNDAITFRLITTGNDGVAIAPAIENWYQHQKYLNGLSSATSTPQVGISGGEGNDTIRTPGAGDVSIDLGAGADTTYTDNTGATRAQWVFNTADQDPAAVLPAARLNTNYLSSTNLNYNLYKGSLTVTFLGTGAHATVNNVPLVSKSVQIGWNPSTFRTNDLYINQAIKNAINTDPVLSKLLVANDGPGYTLIVTALSDGVRVADNLRINFSKPTETLSTQEIAALNTAWAPTVAYVTSADVVTSMGTNSGAANPPALADIGTSFFAAGSRNLSDLLNTFDYRSALSHNGAANDTGSASTSPSDNRITGGAGNDVIVLGTTVGAVELTSSNERVVYGAPFDNDTIVNFLAGALATGGDILDFSGLGGRGSALQAYDNTIPVLGDVGTYNVPTLSILRETLDTGTTSLNDTAAEVAALFLDQVGVGGTTRTYVYVAVNENTNVGYVYAVTDTAAATANVAATFMGTIDLAETLWSTLIAANFA